MRSSCQGEIIFQLSRLNDFSQLKQMMTQLHTSLISYINDFINVTEVCTVWSVNDGFPETCRKPAKNVFFLVSGRFPAGFW